MGKLYLIRHGEVTWNKRACYTGWTDLPLTDNGVSQAVSVAERLKPEPLEAVYCSDLQRAKVTADQIAASHRLTPIVDTDLRELNYGEWEGVQEAQLPVRDPDHYAAWVANPAEVGVPAGESFNQLLARVSQAMSRIMEAHPDGTVAVVAHKSANRVMLCHWLSVNINLYKRTGQDNGAINTVIFNPDRVQVEGINDTCHLSAELVTG
ncbi:MAG: alpha-ribazole phosphatase [Armatimonadota bacterium]|nr:alpha-ribazole phosphatase [Armatimonadota bacterium]